MQEALFWLHAILLGIGLMFEYDLLRIFRKFVRHRAFWIGAEDFFYWLFGAFFIFRLLYTHNHGVIRWFAVAGVFVGMLLYQRIASKWVIRLLTRVIGWTARVLHKPCAFLARTIRRVLRFLNNNRKKVTTFLKKRLKKREKTGRMETSKKGGARRRASGKAVQKKKKTTK